jgi:hypothetical protein
MRGNKKPFVVDFKSSTADALVPPFGFISIDWAEATKEVKIESKISVFFITAVFFNVFWFYSFSDKCLSCPEIAWHQGTGV